MKAVFGCLLLYSLCFYARSFHSYFLADDYEFAGKIQLRDVPQYLWKGFGTGNEYRPLVPFTFALDEWIGHGGPVPFHITNTLIHTANSFLIFTICLAVGLPTLPAIFAMSAFLLNPVAHEPLLWISGRPVLLATFFVLLALRLFLLAGHTALLGSSLCHLLALGTYEGAIVLPFALVGLWLLPRFRAKPRRNTMLTIAAISIGYVIFWSRLFAFRITRFPVEHTATAMAASLLKALVHTLHASDRVVPGILYALLAIAFCRTARGRQLSLILLGFFVVGYLPFFLVQGFADRFAYLSSTAAVIWLGFAFAQFANSRAAILSGCALLVFWGIGMQNRITTWNRAGSLAQTIQAQMLLVSPQPFAHSTIVMEGVPEMYKQAYVYLSGLDSAMELAFHYPITILRDRPQTGSLRVFRWSNSRITEVTVTASPRPVPGKDSPPR